MARTCELCSKSYQRGNLVPRGIGRRVTRRTTMRQHPNIRTVRFDVENSNKLTLRICTSCLKRIRKDEKEQGIKNANAIAVKTAIADAATAKAKVAVTKESTKTAATKTTKTSAKSSKSKA